ncbi:MAG: potassium transporter KefB [Pedobacter sp.]|nr:MAG: potassium transporter KefB [Pedobacter sp.]
MTTEQNINSTHPAPLQKRMVQGAIVGLILISIFLISAGAGKPEWGNWWMIKPLIIVPFAGAVGGAFFFYMDGIRSKGGWNRFLADLISVIIFIIGMWMGSVLGLNGTYWN